MKKKTGKVLLHSVLVLCSFVALYPFFIMFTGSFKTSSELGVNAAGWPIHATLENFTRLLNYNSHIISRTFLNALGVSVVSTVIVLVLASWAGYAFAKFKFKGKKVLFIFFLATMMLPMEVNMTPLFIMFSKLHWLNSYQVQILPGIANVLAMYMYKQYMESLPDSVMESAYLDGAGNWTVYRKIVMPMVKPATSALAIIMFLGKWNDYLMPRTMITKQEFMPIMVILPTLSDTGTSYVIPWELIFAGCVLITIPLLIVFFIFQDKFMSSVVMGAVKE
ncbi:carbohydrate ABC transporter permease [Faecalicatena sp. AGMB00832]|uniref:Carbohydrate ABC transporter permease n=1 Tax=Faecalicatena faecalis TaxID=2726362 RepID=A0ABS6D4G7_9FIRM|nr:carbohydrate ABC transporter permease [Faecalicatena faecalis]MBU3876435.1 carbohydrate ABC transporter permease [Faecalicatena faecalis]